MSWLTFGQSHIHPSLPSMKVATACTQCRASKRKCWRATGLEPCTQCHRNQIACSLCPPPASAADTASAHSEDENGLNSSLSFPVSTTGPDGLNATLTLPISTAVADALVENYIRCIHDRPHSIFHIPTLRLAVRRKDYGARFSSDASVSTLDTFFFDKAKEYLHLDLENVCLENTQTCILLAGLSAAGLRPSSEVLYLGIAIRMAEILRFNVPRREDPIIVQELKRRIRWSLFMADRWCSAGNSLSRKVNGFDKTVELPMDETVFQQTAGPVLDEGHRLQPGLWAYMITLLSVFDSIQDLYWQIARQSLSEERIEDTVSSLAKMLEAWEASLPEHVRYNRTNLCSYRARGLGGTFAALHQGFNHYATLVYYQYLDINRSTTAKTRDFARRCKHYATMQSTLLRTAKDLGNCEMLFPGVGHSAAVSSSVLLHTLLFGQEEELLEARKSLKSNFDILKDLRRYWPSIELTVRRLTVFQNVCLQHTTPKSYNFDDWMVKFLLEYHLPLDDRASPEALWGSYGCQPSTWWSGTQQTVSSQLI
ncbi:hypothetical protein GQ53DRAFT_787148 [Thozetella sp. PMI_491]|nr:hypothetical protein GQ53DRAFT_787148 [Thozetella sp. PMI_491]